MTTIKDGYALLYNNTGKSWWGCLAWVADGIDVQDDAGFHMDWWVIGYRIDWGDGSPVQWIYKDRYGNVNVSKGEAPATVDFSEGQVRGSWTNRYTDRPGEGPGQYYVAVVYHPYLAAGTYDVEVTAHYWDSEFYDTPGFNPPVGSWPRGSYTHVAATTTRPARTNWGSKLTLQMNELNEGYDPDAPDNAFFASAAFADLRTNTAATGPGFHGITAQPPWGRWRGGYYEFEADRGVGLGDDIVAPLWAGQRPEWSTHSDDTLWLPYRNDQLTRLDDGGPVPLWHNNPTYAGAELNTWDGGREILGVNPDGMLVVPVDADATIVDPDFLRFWRLILVNPADRSVVTELVPPLMVSNVYSTLSYVIRCLVSDEEVVIQAATGDPALWVWNFVTDDLWLLNANATYGADSYVRATADGGVLILQNDESVYRVQRNGRDSSPTGMIYDLVLRWLPSYQYAYDSTYGGYVPEPSNADGFPDDLGLFARTENEFVIPDDTDPDIIYLPLWIEPDAANQRNTSNRLQGPAWPDGSSDRGHTRWVTAIYRGRLDSSTWVRVAWMQHPYPWWDDGGSYDRVRHVYPNQSMLPTNIPAGSWLPEPNPPSMVATMAVLGGPRFYIDEPVTVTMHAHMDDTGLLVDSKFTMDWGDYDDSDEHDDVATEHTYTWAFHDAAIQDFFGRLPTADDPIVLTLHAKPRDPVTDRGGIPATATISLYPHRILTDVGPQHARFNPRPALGGQ